MAGEGRGPPPFLRHGAYTVVVFVLAVSALLTTSDLGLGGPSLVAFGAGFVVFMSTYFFAMWVGWLFFG
ncbi:hypothetical protein BRC81_15340 [Halobacteriales archaeon QS_1_68_20]|nr:MAG: hypothetical protein BRC81_15340 [Halobacteriales archaeon QS_1_68_20]